MPQQDNKRFAKVLLGSALGLAALALVLNVEGLRQDQDRAQDAHAKAGDGAALEATNRTPIEPTLTSSAKLDSTAKRRILKSFSHLPIAFEDNKGQTDKSVKFLARGPGYTIFLTPDEAVLTLKKAPKKADSKIRDVRMAALRNTGQAVLRMRFPGSQKDVKIVGDQKFPGKSHYFKGNEPEKWVKNAQHYGKVRYKDVYPGIDLVFYGRQGALEYDFVVSPGADPYAISLAFEGLTKKDGKPGSHIDDQGNLHLQTGGGTVVQKAPVIYQEDALHTRKAITGRYVEKENGELGFQVAAYDKSRTLIIDPVVVYSTYIGGNAGSSCINGLTTDSSGNAYFTGDTLSTDFPTAGTPFDSGFNLSNDVIVTQVISDGSAIGFSTFLGDTGSEFGQAIAVDTAGNIYIGGNTNSSAFPTVNAFQNSNAGGTDCFVAKLGPGGSTLPFSSYYGGVGFEDLDGVALAGNESFYVVGRTNSVTSFPTTVGAFQTTSGGLDDGTFGLISTTATLTSTLAMSSYLGGIANDECNAVTTDSSGNVYIAGSTLSSDFPTAGTPLQATLGAGSSKDGFVTKFNSSGSAVFSTYLGGSLTDTAEGIFVDSSGNTFVTGDTQSTDFPTSSAFQSTLNGPSDAFATCLNSTGSTLNWSTYLGGTGDDNGSGIGQDADGNTYVAGDTNSSDFPTTSNASQLTNGGLNDAFVSMFTPLITTTLVISNSTYLGGSGEEFMEAFALDSQGNTYIGGCTNSSDFPISGTLTFTQTGAFNVFLTKYATVVGSGTAPTPTANTAVTAVLSADKTEGVAPLTVNFDGSASSDPGGGTINQYFFDFGDGTTSSGSSPTVSHVYSTADTYVAALRVRSSSTEVSADDLLPIYAGDGVAGDGDLFLSKAKINLNRSQTNTDSFSCDGTINPNGFPSNLSGATLSLFINGTQISTPISITSRTSRATSRAANNFIALISPSTGKIKVTAKGVNLKNAVPVADATAKDQPERMEVRLTLNNAPTANTPNVKSVIQSSFKSKAGKKSTGVFNFIKLPTFTGSFKSLKTIAKQSSTGDFNVTALGPIQADLSGPVVPNGAITITVGGDGTPSTGAVITIPLAALKIKGAGASSSFTYSKKLQDIPELKKFQINNKRRKFILATNEISGTTIPATGSGQTTFGLRVFISAPTANGTLGFSTNVEIKRTNDSTSVWKR